MQKSSEDYVTIKMGHVVVGVFALGLGVYRLSQWSQVQSDGRTGEAVGSPLGSAIVLIGFFLVVVGWYLFQIIGQGKKVQFGNRSTTKSSLPKRVDLDADQFKDLDI